MGLGLVQRSPSSILAFLRTQVRRSGVESEKACGTTACHCVSLCVIACHCVAGEPPRVLKGFVKTAVLGAGESKSVHFPLRERDLSIWDVKTHNWAQQSGEFKVYVGASSRDIRATGTFTV